MAGLFGINPLPDHGKYDVTAELQDTKVAAHLLKKMRERAAQRHEQPPEMADCSFQLVVSKVPDLQIQVTRDMGEGAAPKNSWYGISLDEYYLGPLRINETEVRELRKTVEGVGER